ncbi:hypothetical protein NMG60_11005418 [Bertholletia excelsa]
MSQGVGRHQRRGSQSVFVLPEDFSIPPLPDCGGGQRVAQSQRPHPSENQPGPPPPVESLEGVSKSPDDEKAPAEHKM